jgi:hypothetical protein
MRLPISVLKEEHINTLTEMIKKQLLNIKETTPQAEEIVIKIEFFAWENKVMVNVNIETYTSLARLENE